VDGIRCTGPERTLVDLAGLVTERTLEAAFDDAIQSGLTTIPKLDAYVTERRLGHNRRVKRLRRLIDDRAKGAIHKELERMFRRKLSGTKMPKPVRQFPVGQYFIDFAWPDRMVAVELHGLGGHFSAEAFRNDKRRENVIVLAGFKVLHFGWEDVCDRWPDVETTLRQSLDGTG
jgi:very-short-patch-repair endonuclease